MYKTMGKTRVAGVLLAVVAALLTACGSDSEDVTIGLITKQEVNPYWVTLREIAEETATDENVNLLTATGTSDVDVTSQQTAIADMVEQGAKGILIAPTIASELLPVITSAQEQGVLVYALDTPFQPEDSVPAYFATDNEAAGYLVGQYAAVKSQQLGLSPKIAMLNLAPGISSGDERHQGFLDGFGIGDDDSAIVAQVNTEGDRSLGEARMTEVLAEHPDVNVIYTVNEPAALGALDALKAAEINLRQTVLVSIEGGCAAIKSAVRRGDIDATSMQFPENMAREGIKAMAMALRGGEKAAGFVDTGVRLITDDEAPGVPSADVAYGVRNCWGN